MKSSVPQGPMTHAPASSYPIDPNEQQLKMSQLGISNNNNLGSNLGSNMYAFNSLGQQQTYNSQPLNGTGSNNFSTMPQYNSMYPQTHSLPMQQTPSYEVNRGHGQFASNPQVSQISQQQYPMNQMNYPMNSGIGQVSFMPSQQQQPVYNNNNNMVGGVMGSAGYPIQSQQPPNNNLFYPSQPTSMGNMGDMNMVRAMDHQKAQMYSSSNIGMLQQKNIYQPPNIPMNPSQQNKNTNISSNNISKNTNSDPFDFLN